MSDNSNLEFSSDEEKKLIQETQYKIRYEMVSLLGKYLHFLFTAFSIVIVLLAGFKLFDISDTREKIKEIADGVKEHKIELDGLTGKNNELMSDIVKAKNELDSFNEDMNEIQKVIGIYNEIVENNLSPSVADGLMQRINSLEQNVISLQNENEKFKRLLVEANKDAEIKLNALDFVNDSVNSLHLSNFITEQPIRIFYRTHSLEEKARRIRSELAGLGIQSIISQSSLREVRAASFSAEGVLLLQNTRINQNVSATELRQANQKIRNAIKEGLDIEMDSIPSSMQTGFFQILIFD